MIKPKYFFIFMLVILVFGIYQVFTTDLDAKTHFILNGTSIGIAVFSMAASIINISKFHSLKIARFALTGAILAVLVPVVGRAIL